MHVNHEKVNGRIDKDINAIPSGDQLIQLAYATAIKSLPGTPAIDDINSLYICPPTSQGIAAGDWVPKDITNAQLYRVGDYLLPKDSPVFVPGSGSYVDSIRKYLSYVQVDGNPSPGAKIRYTNALAESNAASDAFNIAREEAIKAFNQDPDQRIGFEKWTQTYDTVYVNRDKANQSAAGTLKQAMRDYYGPGADILNEQITKIDSAKRAVSVNDGVNMAAIYESLDFIQENFEAAQNGEKPDKKVDGLFYLPLYNFPRGNYGSTVNAWVEGYSTVKETEIKIDIEHAESQSWSEAGFSKISAGADLSYWYFLTAKATFDTTEETKTLDTKRASSEISLKLTCSGAPAWFDVGQGDWDVKAVQKQWPKLIKDAPKDIIPDMVQVKQLLIAYGVGIEAHFKGDTLKDVTNLVDAAEKTGGKVNFFGFDIGADVSGSYQRTLSTSFQDAKFDAESGKLSSPATDNGYPVLLAVVGQRLIPQ